jgi:hypothetical protein
MKSRTVLLFLFIISTKLFAQNDKAPAYPLITHDPYFSIWSMNDELMDGTTKHWTGTDHSLQGFLEVDGKSYGFLGDEPIARMKISCQLRMLNFT